MNPPDGSTAGEPSCHAKKGWLDWRDRIRSTTRGSSTMRTSVQIDEKLTYCPSLAWNEEREIQTRSTAAVGPAAPSYIDAHRTWRACPCQRRHGNGSPPLLVNRAQPGLLSARLRRALAFPLPRCS